MKQEYKELLLKDLCARLPYGVKCYVPVENCIMELTGKRLNYFCFHKKEWGIDYSHEFEVVLDPLNDARNVYIVKPYLRPMSSMTEEECLELSRIKPIYDEVEAWKYIKTPIPLYIANVEQFEFFNIHHLDWRNLIPKGLALEAPEGMYE